MAKRKILPFLILPFMLLAGCSSISSNMVEQKVNKVNTNKTVKMAMVSPDISIVPGGGGGGGSTIGGYQSSGYPSFYGYEKHDHVIQMTYNDSNNDYVSYHYHDTGVKIYGSNTSVNVGSDNDIEINSSTPFIDFTNANCDLPEIFTSENYTSAVTHYLFEIYSGSSRRFYVEATLTFDTDTDIYTKVLNTNGSKRTSTSSTYSFSPTEFGTVGSNLYSGSYTIKLTMDYEWMRMGSVNQIAYYTTSTELSGSLLIDYTVPSLTAYGYTSAKTIPNGAYTNERVRLSATDTNFFGLYYKIPGSTSYSSASGTSVVTPTTNGLYEYYAIDSLGNKTDIRTFYYDSVKPSGKIYSNGSSISSGSYVSNSFSYAPTDSGSGIVNIYYKTPITGTYQTYTAGTIIPSNSGDGWYYFYAVDKAGNISDTMSVYLETANPLIEIYRNGEVAFSSTITGSGTFDTGIYYNKSDLLKISYDSSSGQVTSNYSLDTNINLNDFSNSEYTITLTTPTGTTVNYIFHIVDEQPYILINNQKYYSGELLYFNEDIFVSWFDDSDIADSANTGVKISSYGDTVIDEFVKFNDGSGKTLTTTELTETTYTLLLTDRAGNEASFKIIIDKKPTSAIWLNQNGNILEDGGYSANHIKLEIEETTSTATYSKDGGEYQPYASGTMLTEEGSYTIVVVDIAGNKSTFTHHIDYTAPTGVLYANYQEVLNGTVTNEKIYFSWDGDNVATVNGREYAKNKVISEDGVYNFVLMDKVGNYTEYQIQIDTVSPKYNQDKINSSKDYLVGKWFNVEFNDSTYSFADYETALNFACQIEYENYVTALELTDINNFTQYHLVASKGEPQEEVKVGTYYRYKSQANPSNELYYFDTELLNEVIRTYAKEYVSSVNYYNLVFNHYGELNENMYDNQMISDGINVPCINGYVFEKEDSKEVYAQLIGSGEGKVLVEFGKKFDEQFNITGLYEITEIDEAGNSSTYQVFLDKTPPEIVVDAEVFGTGSTNEITITKDSVSEIGAYYYKTFAVKELVDNDSWSTIVIENEGVKTYYSKGDQLPTLNIGGEYQVSVYDRLGNTYEFTVFIVGNEATVEFTPNSDSTEFDIEITLEQEFDTLITLDIYKDGEKLEGISTNVLNYTFTKDGVYTVVMRDNFGRVIEKTYDFVKSLPEGTLSIENGSKTTNSVTFEYDNSKYYAEIIVDGNVIDTNEDGFIQVNKDGSYEIKLINLTDEENINTYSFVIDTKAPDVILSGVNASGTTNTDVNVSWNDTDVLTSTYSINGGETKSFNNNTTFTEEGIYVVTVIDDLGNKTELTFTIDKTLDYAIYVNDTSLSDVETTNQDITVINNEELNVEVTKNGEKYEFNFGDTLNEEGVYVFKVYDSFGNSITFKITIDKSVDVYSTAGNGTISNDDVVITAGEKVNVIVTKDGQEFAYTLGQAITEEGKYKVTIYDTYGNEKTIQFQIIKGTKTNLDYSLGDNVEVVEVKKDSEVIEHTSNDINFTEDGTYEIKVISEGQEYTFELSLDTTAPEVTLNGIEDGEVANVTVTITDMNEEGTIEVYKDGVKIDYVLGDEIKDYGTYEVKVTDSLGNARSYTFTLEYQMNAWTIALIGIGVLAIAGLVVLIVLKKRRAFKK